MRRLASRYDGNYFDICVSVFLDATRWADTRLTNAMNAQLTSRSSGSEF